LRANTERGAMLAPTARPNLMAQTTASRLSTGSTPGRAMSTALAWTLGSAPKAMLLPEKIFDFVCNWAWVSSPMTTSHWLISIPPAYEHASR
jgi:hypothetical protein